MDKVEALTDRVHAAIAELKAQTDTILLGFSGGKDSVGCWLTLRPHFKTIIPIYHYLVPGLSFVERSLAYYEKFFDTHIVRLPHPLLYKALRFGIFQTPAAYQVCEWWDLPKEPSFREMADYVAEDYKLPHRWKAIGVRAADSLNRRLFFQQRGVVNRKEQTFYPIAHMRKAELVELIRSAGIKLSMEYATMGRSFDGYDAAFIRGIKAHYPADYRRILEWFPLIEAELFRAEVAHGKS